METIANVTISLVIVMKKKFAADPHMEDVNVVYVFALKVGVGLLAIADFRMKLVLLKI